jgi:hypothetical protein
VVGRDDPLDVPRVAADPVRCARSSAAANRAVTMKHGNDSSRSSPSQPLSRPTVWLHGEVTKKHLAHFRYQMEGRRCFDREKGEDRAVTRRSSSDSPRSIQDIPGVRSPPGSIRQPHPTSRSLPAPLPPLPPPPLPPLPLPPLPLPPPPLPVGTQLPLMHRAVFKPIDALGSLPAPLYDTARRLAGRWQCR